MTELENSLLNVHHTILNALEEDVYREYIGRFHIERATTEKLEIKSTEERRVHLADEIKHYKLHLKLSGEEVPGTTEKLEHISFEYERRRPRPKEHYEDHSFKIRAGFPLKSDEPKSFGNEFTCWEFHYVTGCRFPKTVAGFSTFAGFYIGSNAEVRNLRMTTTSHSVSTGIYRGNELIEVESDKTLDWVREKVVTKVIREFTATDKTLDWIYDQLTTSRNPPAEEKAKQLARLLSCGDNLEGTFHYAALGGVEQKELPDFAVPHEGKWRIERIDRPHRERLFMLTAPKVAPDYMLMVAYSSIDNVFDGHEFRPGEEKQPRTFSRTENPHLLDKALDAIARRVGYNWK